MEKLTTLCKYFTGYYEGELKETKVRQNGDSGERKKEHLKVV
jgi:hypothetical protein